MAQKINIIPDIPIILASGSPRRRELLEQAGYKFTIQTSGYSEETDILTPKDFVMELADRKAKDVSGKELIKRSKGQKTVSPFLVLGADTVVALNGRILGKPIDYDDAYNTLQSLSGQTHHVYTGVSLVYYDGSKSHNKCFFECTEVTFYPMTHEEIVWYLSTDEPFDKAGSYGIQGKGGIFIKEISGDYNNVVGLPLAKVHHEIQALITK